jgi:hypothetical protein
MKYRTRDNTVGIATDYGPDDRGVGVRALWGQEVSFLQVIQTASTTLPVSYPMDTGSSSPGVKRQGREADNSPPTSAEVKKM